MSGYVYPHYPFVRPPELDGRGKRHRVAIAGGGPVGLTAALELAAYGVPSVVFEDGDTVSEGSRALCWSKRTLEILDRYGVAERIRAKGFTWNTGRVFVDDREVYQFSLQPQGRHKHPAFVNLQQYYAEQYLVEAVLARPLIELRWQSKVVGAMLTNNGATLEISTPDGHYAVDADYVIAADGARSSVRRCLGLDFAGRVFEDHFLIADVKVLVDLPARDRRFWFHPTFHNGDTALCHKQGDDLWRVDFQLGPNIDPELEKHPERALPRVKAMLGDHPMEVSWISIYTFQARRLERLRHGCVLFAGDAAHQVSPFGARGGNSGIQDAENLAWKLAYVVLGKAPDALLDSYEAERGYAADENIRITSRTTNFLTPKTPAARMLRDAVLELATDYPFARALVNSGRLSTPTIHTESPLNGDLGDIEGGVLPGAPCPNFPLADGYLLDRLGGRFHGLYFAAGNTSVSPATGAALRSFAAFPMPVECLVVGPDRGMANGLSVLIDETGAVAHAFAAEPGSFYLIRPDQHVAARWREFDAKAVPHALDRALGKN